MKNPVHLRCFQSVHRLAHDLGGRDKDNGRRAWPQRKTGTHFSETRVALISLIAEKRLLISESWVICFCVKHVSSFWSPWKVSRAVEMAVNQKRAKTIASSMDPGRKLWNFSQAVWLAQIFESLSEREPLLARPQLTLMVPIWHQFVSKSKTAGKLYRNSKRNSIFNMFKHQQNHIITLKRQTPDSQLNPPPPPRTARFSHRSIRRSSSNLCCWESHSRRPQKIPGSQSS